MHTRRSMSMSVSVKRVARTSHDSTDTFTGRAKPVPVNTTLNTTLNTTILAPAPNALNISGKDLKKCDKEAERGLEKLEKREKVKTPRFFEGGLLGGFEGRREKENAGKREKVKTPRFDMLVDAKGKERENSARKEKSTPRVDSVVALEETDHLVRAPSADKVKFALEKEKEKEKGSEEEKEGLLGRSAEKLDGLEGKETKEQDKPARRKSTPSSPRKMLGRLSLSSKSNVQRRIGVYLEKGHKAGLKGNIDKAMHNFDKALALEPTCSNAWNKKGFLYYNIKKYEESIECYDKAIAFDTENAMYWNNKGGSYLAMEKFETALECFNKAIEMKDRYAVALNNKGVALRNLKRHDEAMKCHYRSIQIDPSMSISWHQLGKVKHVLSEFQEAIDCFDRAIELDSTCYQAYYGKAMALREIGKHEEAMKFFDVVLKMNPSYENAWEMIPIVPPKEAETLSPSKAMRRLSLEESSTQSKLEILKNMHLDTDGDLSQV